MTITQLDTTLIASGPKRASSHAAGRKINTQGRASSTSNCDPDAALAVAPQKPALSDIANVAAGAGSRLRWTIAAVAPILIQQPRKAPSSQLRGNGKRPAAPMPARSVTRLVAQSL